MVEIPALFWLRKSYSAWRRGSAKRSDQRSLLNYNDIQMRSFRQYIDIKQFSNDVCMHRRCAPRAENFNSTDSSMQKQAGDADKETRLLSNILKRQFTEGYAS